jgi:hypothetical protein
MIQPLLCRCSASLRRSTSQISVLLIDRAGRDLHLKAEGGGLALKPRASRATAGRLLWERRAHCATIVTGGLHSDGPLFVTVRSRNE